MAAYGLQGMPRGRAGGPGWPQRSSIGAVNGDITKLPSKVVVVRSAQIVRVPDWATFARMGATGSGGQGSSSTLTSTYGNGGGGGGFSGTNAVKVGPGTSINIFFTSAATVIEGLGYRLTGGNGGDGNSAFSGAGIGGVGTGGDVNFNGGNGGSAINTGATGGGGGAASRGGAGVQGGSPTSGASSGGQGGQGSSNIGGGSGGGCGALNGARGSVGPVGSSVASTTFGVGVITVGLAGSDVAGGDGGGGGGSQIQATFVPNNGGAGFAIIEFW